MLIRLKAGADVEAAGQKKEHLASQCLPQHYDDSGVAQPAGLRQPGRAVATAPVTCELCHVGLAGFDSLKAHCVRKHGNFAEYRKRVFFKARLCGLCELQPWVKRSMVQSFQFFRLHSVPASCSEWTHKATQEAELRREEACAICAVKDWLENRFRVYLFKEAAATTTWSNFFFAAGSDSSSQVDCDEETSFPSGGSHSAV